MSDVVDRVHAPLSDDAGARRAEARRVLLILSLFVLVAVVANFWL